MNELVRTLRTHYEQAAAGRATQPPEPRRVAERAEFVAQLQREGRTVLLEVGCGAGHDVAAFVAAGLYPVAIDLAHAHALLACANGAGAAQGMLPSLPVRPQSVDAVWCMSTLLHIPDADLGASLNALSAAVVPGGLMAVGLWGGHDRELLGEFDSIEPRRYFRLRTHEQVKSWLEPIGTITQFVTWPDHRSDWVYQFAVVRLP